MTVIRAHYARMLLTAPLLLVLFALVAFEHLPSGQPWSSNSLTPVSDAVSTATTAPPITTFYVHSVFYFSEKNETKMIAVSNCTTLKSLKTSKITGFTVETEFQVEMMMDGCPEVGCGFTGYYLTCKQKPNSALVLPLITLSPSSPENVHFLTACISPMTWYVDWQNFIDWMEVWLVMGLNHLHAYRLSISPEVQTVMKMYIPLQLLTLHEWPLLPDDLSDHLNLYGQLTSYHDCLQHNHYTATFTAFVDLDELLTVRAHDTAEHEQQYFVSYLRDLPPNLSALHMQCLMAYPVFDRNQTGSLLNDHSMAHLAAFDLETDPHFVKKIVRPQRVYRLRTHYLLQATAGSIEKTANVSETFLTHVRKPIRPATGKNRTVGFTGLARVAKKAVDNWRHRMLDVQTDHNLFGHVWPISVFRVFQLMDECSAILSGQKRPGCWSFYRCRKHVNLNTSQIELVYPEASEKWHVL